MMKPHETCSPKLVADIRYLELIHRLATLLINELCDLPLRRETAAIGQTIPGKCLKKSSGLLDADPTVVTAPPPPPLASTKEINKDQDR